MGLQLGVVVAFLDALDGRYRIARALKSRLKELHADLGGPEHLSYAERSLCKRVLFLEASIEGVEARLAQGEAVDIGPWVQSLNSMLGLYRVLGVERRSRDVSTLQEYLRDRADDS